MKKKCVFSMWVVMVCVLTIPVLSVSAKEKVTLRMLIWEGYAPKDLEKAFAQEIKNKYDIDVSFEKTFVSNPDEFSVALKKDKADIISPSHHQPKDEQYKLITGKLTLALDMDKIPNYSNVLPALQKADYITVSDKVYGIPVVRGPYGLVYNTTIIKEEPKSWNIFFDPQYKDKYTISGDFYEANVFTVALACGVSEKDIFNPAKVAKPEVTEKLKIFAENAHSFWIGVDTEKDLKGLALATSWGFSLPALKKLGEEWKLATPDEGTTGWVDNFMLSSRVSADPTKLKIAYEWLNFVLSDQYQTYCVRGLGCPPVTTSVKGKLKKEEIAKYHLDDPNYFANNIILWQPLKKAHRAAYEMLWKKASKAVAEEKIAAGKARNEF
ncbi:MAG: extracellular solute-binding protein [Phycisphaerae bacterium]|nr:extracellular solute-binding protein [Phycisphaerae bacterium]